MGFLDSFLEKINISGDDEGEFGYDAAEEEGGEAEAEEAAARTEKKPVEVDETPAVRKKSSRAAASSKVVPIHNTSIPKQAEVCMVLPKGYESSTEIAEILIEGKTVVLNLEGMNIDTAQRIIDFTSGACFTMGGLIQKISKKIFIATPSNVQLTGDFSSLFGDDADMTSLNLTV